MGMKSIGIRDDVYERLKARKRDDESFSDLVERLLDDATVDWRDGFGTLDPDELEEMKRVVEQSRTRINEGLAQRQQETIEGSSEDSTNGDKTA